MLTVDAMQVVPMTGVLGAEVLGVDLSRKHTHDEIEAFRALLAEHSMVCFRDQQVDDDAQLRFAGYFGEVQPQYHYLGGTSAPGIGILDQESGDQPGYRDACRWHTDHTFYEEPPSAAVLRAVQVPATGGDTAWSSMYAAYDALSEPMRQMLAGLTATHSVRPHLTDLEDVPADTISEARHPVIRTHPVTGKQVIFVCPMTTLRIEELAAAESAAVLAFLFEHVKNPAFQCRVRWQPGTVVIWDERATQHCAIPDYRGRRVMHRCIIRGERPYGPARAAA